MASFELPGKLLQDFYTDDPAIERLFDEMRIITARFRPQILEKHATGKTTAMKMGEDRFVGYRRTIGSYELRGAEIPYLIEAVLTKTDDEDDDEHPERNTVNALTMPELIDFIRAKIPKKQLRPTREQIREMISFDADALKRDAVTQYLLSQVEDHMEMLSDVDVSIDADKMADQIDHALDNGRRGEKWQHVLSSVIERRQEKAMIRLQEALGSNV